MIVIIYFNCKKKCNLDYFVQAILKWIGYKLKLRQSLARNHAFVFDFHQDKLSQTLLILGSIMSRDVTEKVAMNVLLF